MSGANAYFEKESTRIGRLAKSLPEQVAESLLAAIHDGAIAPGERLKEEIYAERFAVSRSTVREAMALLERRGVVERVPRYGVRVIAVDAEEIEEIFNIRAQLLGLAARLVTEKPPEGFVAQLVERAADLRKLADAADTAPGDYASLSIDTQRMLMGACPGKRLRTIYEGLSDQALWRYAIREKSISFSTQQRRRESAADWTRLAQAVAASEGAAAESAAKELLLASYRAVVVALGADGKA
ncbi:GntR family transcriptional regulator [Bordetella petrii]|uniref:GntR family transcriptional regulator n=1 Tax=Bordetella petrii TaxID=94624 RepID=UPI001E603B47|nr:GntR family transcriptional regulator [Bordetella petrii]MCD0502008.1 GntR family transcriptional regulator [Bordetella petrii]